MLTCICGKEIPEGRKYCSPRCCCKHLNNKEPEPVPFFDEPKNPPPDFDPSLRRCECCNVLDELTNGLCYRCLKLVANKPPIPEPLILEPYPTPEPDDDEPEETIENKRPEDLYQ